MKELSKIFMKQSTFSNQTNNPQIWKFYFIYFFCHLANKAVSYVLKQGHNAGNTSLMEKGRLGGVTVLGKLPVPGRPTIWITVGQGPIALAVGAGGGCLDIFTLIYPFSPLSPSL